MFKKGERIKIIDYKKFHNKFIAGKNYCFPKYRDRMEIYNCYGKSAVVLGCDYGERTVHIEITDRYEKEVEISLPFEFVVKPKNKLNIETETSNCECDFCKTGYGVKKITISSKLKGSKELHLCSSCRKEIVEAFGEEFGL